MNGTTQIKMTMAPPQIDGTIYKKPYLVIDGCLNMETMVKNQVKYVKLADFVPVLTEEITHDDGTEKRKLFKVSAVHQSGVVLPEQIVSADDMQSMKWLLQRWGQYGAVQPGQSVPQKICHAIMSPQADVPRTTVYTQTGWRKLGGEYQFLMPMKDSPLNVELQGKLNRYRFDKQGEIDDLLPVYALLDMSFAPKRVLLPLTAVTFLSPLNHFLKAAGHEPKFVTALIGKTGSRKSTLAALFLSFFGRFTSSDLPLSFHDTANSILSNIYHLKDVLTCIDDFHPAGRYQEKEMRSIAQNISRYYGDRIGRGRLNCKAEEQVPKPPTGNAIITAEFSPEISVSGTARFFEIELKDNEIDLKVLTEYQQLAEENKLSSVMMMYIDWLRKTYLTDEKSFIKKLSGMFCKFRRQYTERLLERKIITHSRAPENLAHLRIGLVFLLKFLQSYNYLQQGEYEKITLSFDEVLIDSCRRSAEQIAEEDPVTKFCAKLTGLLDSGKCYVENKNDFGGAAQKGFIGLEDTDCYYLLADAVHAEVKRQCAEQDEHFSITKKDLLKQLADEQILKKSGERNTTTIRSGGGKLMSVIVLDKQKIARRLSRDLCPPYPTVDKLPDPQAQEATQGNVAQV